MEMRALLVSFTLLLAACADLPQRPPPPSVAEVVQMSKDMPAEQIVQRMRESGAVYRLSASQLARLHEQGVPDQVIDHMQATLLDEMRREAAMDMMDPWPRGWGPGFSPGFGWPYRNRLGPWGWW